VEEVPEVALELEQERLSDLELPQEKEDIWVALHADGRVRRSHWDSKPPVRA
jgi:hypothetical protein